MYLFLLLFNSCLGTDRVSKPKDAIIIVTFMRSGSTFLGELFNVHKATFYMFAPLHPLMGLSCDQDTIDNEKYNILLDRSRCNFPDMYNTSVEWKQISKNYTTHQKLDQRGNFVFRGI